jgi:hypothetical protein
VTLTPTANTTLTVAESGKSVTQAGTAAHGITIGGTATLVSGSTYTVASEASKKGSLTVDADGVLTLGGAILSPEGYTHAEPTIVLTGATASNAATLVLKGGGTTGGTLVVDATQSTAVTLGTLSTSNFVLTNNSGDAATQATVTKDGSAVAASVVVKGAQADASAGVLLGSIGGGGTASDNDATVTGPTTAVNSAIAKGWKVKVPNT